MKTQIRNYKIIPLLLFCFITCVIIIVGVYIQNSEIEDVVNLNRLRLRSIADLKVGQIDSWRKERLLDAHSIFNNASLINDLKYWFKNRTDKIVEKRILRCFSHFPSYQYFSISIYDKNALEQLSITAAGVKIGKEDNDLVANSYLTKKVILSDISKEDDSEIIHLDLVVPLLDGSEIIGGAVLRIDPERFLFPFIRKWPINNYSSETLLSETKEDSIVFLNDLRYNSNAALNFKIPLTQKEVLAVKGALGFEGVTDGIDYRGVKVIGAVQRIPQCNWVVVAKIDKEEIMQPLRKRSIKFYAVMFIVIISGGIIAFLFIKNQNKSHYAKLLEVELEKKKAETNMLATEAKFQSLFNSMKEGVAIHKLVLNEKGEAIDYIILDINSAFENQTGISLEKARGANASELYGDANPPYLDIYSKVAFTGAPCEFETYFSPLNRYFKISVTSLGELMFATIFLDITDLKKNEEKIKKTMLNLEQSNKELEQFAYIASHDLQEPLRMVSSFTQLLAKKYKGQLSEEADGYIKFAVDGATRMQILINDLLEYSRVTRKGLPFASIDTKTVLETAIKNLKRKIEDNNAVIKSYDLPVIFADEMQMVRLFQNLIDNSIKYKSDETPNIEITALDNVTKWQFSIKDNGIGIDPDYKEKIFEIFERLHSVSKYPGTGIGLAICKKIVERHGGKIWVESNTDSGVTFNFTIIKRDEKNAN